MIIHRNLTPYNTVLYILYRYINTRFWFMIIRLLNFSEMTNDNQNVYFFMNLFALALLLFLALLSVTVDLKWSKCYFFFVDEYC